MFKPQLLNCLWLLIPVCVWNAVFARQLPQEGFHSDDGVSHFILIAEHILRIAVFLWPLFLPLRWEHGSGRTGMILFSMGLLIYFGSWIPLLYYPQAAWSLSTAGLLAPAYTSLVWLFGIALIGASWPYGLLSLFFVAVHVHVTGGRGYLSR